MEGEKRRQRRFPADGPVTVTLASGEPVDGGMVDIGLLGFRFRTTELLEIGERLSATIRFPSGSAHAVEGTVTSVRQHETFEYGVAFTPQTVERLIKDLFKPS